jgi:pSer/pThr/pTyr-binding forkhead associated (FHA) protein
MKNIFSRAKTDKPVLSQDKILPVTPLKRDAIIGFIVQSLKPYVDEKGLSVAGLHFYIASNSPEQEEAARVALYTDKPGLFKTEHLERKLLNHFIQLEPGWFFESTIVKDLPEDCLQQDNFGLKVTRTGELRIIENYSTARLQVLMGQAEHHEYLLDPHTQLKFYIGRSKAPQLSSGKIQINDIVFLSKGEPGFDEVAGRANLHVSRNHAYIVYDPKTDLYFLYPDKGGLPDNGNKIKVHTSDDKVKWLNIYGVAHILQDGDQIELGGEAVIRFRNG